MKNLTLTPAELTLIKTQRAEAKAIANKESNKLKIKTQENKAEAIKKQEDRVKEVVKDAKLKADKMKAFDTKLKNTKGNEIFTLVSRIETMKLRADFYASFTNAKYKKHVEFLKTNELAIEQVKANKNGDLSRYDMDGDVRESFDSVEYGVRVYLKEIEVEVEVVTYETLDWYVPVTESAWNTKTEEYEQVTSEKPAFQLVYGFKKHGYDNVHGVTVVKADNKNLYYDFNKGNSSYYKEVYRTANKIVKNITEQYEGYDQRVEQENKQKRDEVYQAKKYAEFLKENKSILNIKECDSRRLQVVYKNGVTLNLGGGLCSDKQDEFTLFPTNFNLPSWYETNLSVEGQKAFAHFITKFNFQIEK